MRVLVDMDGVAVDWHRGALELHNKPWPFDVHRGDAAWDLPKLCGMSLPEFYGPMDYHFWANLYPTPEANDIIWLLASNFGWRNLCFLTSPCRTSGCIEGKREWVRQHYPKIPILFSVTSFEKGATPPKWFCAGPDSLLIDDCTANVQEFRAAGGHAILMPRPWNELEGASSFAFGIVKEIIETRKGERDGPTVI